MQADLVVLLAVDELRLAPYLGNTGGCSGGIDGVTRPYMPFAEPPPAVAGPATPMAAIEATAAAVIRRVINSSCGRTGARCAHSMY